VADVMALNEREAIKDRRLLIICGVVLAVVCVGFIGHAALHIEPLVVALLGAGILGAAVAQSAARLHASVEWEYCCSSPACSSWSARLSRPRSSAS
jgi:Na+/H+ antiporter NhaD/arsenite permease-like protein